MKKFYFLITSIVLIVAFLVYPIVFPRHQPDFENGEIVASNLIEVYSPRPFSLVSSPLTITGQARGYWYFEADFPIKIVDADGNLLVTAIAHAQNDWMTEEMVPFEAVVEFDKPATEGGKIILMKDNPSGLPENDDSITIPVIFLLDSWPVASESGECKVTGCSGQICSDQEVITTCEFKDEYLCYENAVCERQEDGHCGWTPTEELVSCIGRAWGVPEGEL